MAITSKKAILSGNIQKVWDTVTSVERYTWRSDLSRTEILNEKQFVEYTKEGYPTTFTVTLCEPCKRWEFDMENGNMRGHWIGVFAPKGGQTEINLIEEVIAKRRIMKPFVRAYLKRQQARFLSDLERELSEKE